jgi:hypothetical protein
VRRDHDTGVANPGQHVSAVTGTAEVKRPCRLDETLDREGARDLWVATRLPQ